MSNVTTVSSLISRERSRAANEVSNLLGTDRRRVETAMNNSLMFLVQQPPLRQFGVGVGAGWLSGYVFVQVSRLAAILGGCTALALWAAHSAGVVELNWERMRSITDSQTVHQVQEYAEQSLQEHHHLVNRVVT
ncbi:uncharacterized protein [Dysidea avara]|uniref:uncharacterized protein isoform X2 n=1 Tax=Dysidea avara TaxID=196820 RepID=UPI003323CA16